MKKQLLFILITLNSFSQYKDFDSFKLKLEDKPSNISLQITGKEKYRVLIDFSSSYCQTIASDIQFVINNKDLEKFKEFLNNVKIKYSEWINTANENNVKDLSKIMKFNFGGRFYFKYGNARCATYSDDLYAKVSFHESSTGNMYYMLTLFSYNIDSFDNKYLTCKTASLNIDNVEELEMFIKKFDIEKMNKIAFEPSKDNLFKD